MFNSRLIRVLVIFVAAGGFWSMSAHAARPTSEELALGDRWVNQHFPNQLTPAADAPAQPPTPARVIAWTSLGPVCRNVLPTLPLQIADRKFSHGLFCHAPSRVQVFLPGPARSFSAVVGILTNPNSQGGSVIFSVDVGSTRLFSSAAMHRGETGAPMSVDLGGARDFILSTRCAGDGLWSDQGVWGDAEATLLDGTKVCIGDYYPLTPYRKDANAWAAYQFDLPEAGEGIVHAFRRKACPDRTISLRLRGLVPGARYLVRDIDGGEPREALGRELLEAGLKAAAAEPQTALIFTYRR